jgi:biotin-dependent carboxylase-like uncharacterized protein
MSAVATIIKPGLQTTIQDAGRTGARHLGVPQSGAADRISFALANAAAGNPWDAPALECALTGPTLEFSSPSGFALGGADMDASLNNAPVDLYRYYETHPGDRLTLGPARIGARCYIAIAGGIASDKFLGSVSTYLPARRGGIKGRALRGNDIVETGGAPGAPQEIPNYLRPILNRDCLLRAIPGPEANSFEPEILRCFFSTKFTADKRGDRMGLRMTGNPITAHSFQQMKSSAVFPGTVQCPSDGAPFLLLPDAQTIGGYARIAQVISADLHLTGQIRPGDQIWFNNTSASNARDIAAKKTAFYAAILNDFHLD